MPMFLNPAAAAALTRSGGVVSRTVRCASEIGRPSVMDTDDSTAGARSLLEQDAMPRVSADEHLVALGHRIRCGQAHDERPAVPVDVVLGEVALEHALADPGRPGVERCGRASAVEPQPDGTNGHQSLAAARLAGRGAVDERATGCLDDHEPIVLEIRTAPAPDQLPAADEIGAEGVRGPG